MKTVIEQVKEIMIDEFGTTPEVIKDDSKLSDLEYDSLDYVELVMACESHFEIDISDEEVDYSNHHNKTVGNIAKLCEENLT